MRVPDSEAEEYRHQNALPLHGRDGEKTKLKIQPRGFMSVFEQESEPQSPAPLPNARFDRCFRGSRGNREIPSSDGISRMFQLTQRGPREDMG